MKTVKKIIVLLCLIFSTSCNGTHTKRVEINESNISSHFTIENNISGDPVCIYPVIDLMPINCYWYEVEQISLLLTISYEIEYYCYRYLDDCYALNSASFSSRYSIGELRVTKPIKEKISIHDLSGVCDHSMNEKSLKITSYYISSVTGYYIYEQN